MTAAIAARALPELLAGLTAGDIPDQAVSDVALDSRAVAPGGLFLATRGTRTHGLTHLQAAVARGAAAIAWEPATGVVAPATAVPAVAVEELGHKAGEIAARFFGRPAEALFTVGVTGTDGKTSTAHLTAQALDALDVPCAYFGTIGHGRLGDLREATHTTPDAVRIQAQLAVQRDAGVRACAMEVSSHALDQSRVGGMVFDVAILTNVGRDHLDYHGTAEAYAAAKRRLFEPTRSRHVVLNRDDGRGAAWIEALPAGDDDRLVVYGLGGAAPARGRFVIGDALRLDAGGLGLDLRTSWGKAELNSPLLGRFNAYNLMAALAALLVRGTPLPAAVSALGRATTVPGRIEAFRGTGDRPLVVVDYAHTPQALDNVLVALGSHCEGRLICVFGAGGDRDNGKRPLMGAAVAAHADVAIVTDDNPRSEDPEAIVAAIVAGAPEFAFIVDHDRASAIARAIGMAKTGDVVLVAGKGHETTQTSGDEVRAFSDRAQVARILGLEGRP